MSWLLDLIPWYIWVGAGALVLVCFIPVVGPIVLGVLSGFVRLVKAAWVILPDRAKLALGVMAALGILVMLHFWDVREKVKVAESQCDARWEKKLADAKAEYDKALAALKLKQQEVVTRTVIQYRDRTKIVKEEGDAVVQIIPALVTAGALPGGMRVAHDAAASGHVPDDPVGAAAAAESVEAAAFVTTVAENYQSCHRDAERLIALQALVTSLQGASP